MKNRLGYLKGHWRLRGNKPLQLKTGCFSVWTVWDISAAFFIHTFPCCLHQAAIQSKKAGSKKETEISFLTFPPRLVSSPSETWVWGPGEEWCGAQTCAVGEVHGCYMEIIFCTTVWKSGVTPPLRQFKDSNNHLTNIFGRILMEKKLVVLKPLSEKGLQSWENISQQVRLCNLAGYFKHLLQLRWGPHWCSVNAN